MLGPPITKNLLGLLGAVQQDEDLEHRYREALIAPQRRRIAVALRAAARRGEVDLGLDVDVEPEQLDVVCDLLIGPVLMRLLQVRAAPLDEQLVRRSVEGALLAMATPASTPAAPRGHRERLLME